MSHEESAVDRLVVTACRRAAERRQPFCTAEQLLEVVLASLGHVREAERVSAYLDAQRPMPFQPRSVGLSRNISTRVLPAATALADLRRSANPSAEDLLATLLSPTAPIHPSLKEEIAESYASSTDDAQLSFCRSTAAANVMPPTAETGGEIELCQPFDETEGEVLVTREELVDQLLLALLHSSPILVGPVGSGRGSLVRLLASRLRCGPCPHQLTDAKLMQLNATRLVAGTMYRGDLEQRCHDLFSYLSSQPHPVILFVEDVAGLAAAPTAGSGFDLLGALAAALSGERFRLIAICSRDDLRERLEPHPRLLAQSTLIAVDPPSEVETARLLSELPAQLSRHHHLELSPNCAEQAIRLCGQHLPHLSALGAAARLLRSAAAALGFERSMLEVDPGRLTQPYWSRVGGGANTQIMGERHLLDAMARQHRIPFEHLDASIAAKVDAFDVAFRSHIFGQGHVRQVVAHTLQVALLQLADPTRPRGRLFFIGPPGTGKSECAKLIAQQLVGSKNALLRFDMSEFSSESAVSTLIGSDKGLVGSTEGGRLTEPLRENPHRVILFDEIEKAHPAVFNIFLQLLEYGQLTDKRGCAVSFRHALCIFTSNAGCDGGEDLVGRSRSELAVRLGKIFRPEFIDRIEEFVPFMPLDDEARESVAHLQLTRLRDQVRRVHGLELVWEPSFPRLALNSRQGEPGVRHVLRWLQSCVKPVIAQALLVATRSEHAQRTMLLSATDAGEIVAT